MYNNFGVNQHSTSNNNNPSGGIRLNFITPSDQSKFEDLFKRAAASNGGKQITANAVRDILIRSRLDNDSLAKIWDLSSIAKAPYLTFPEFAVAMYLTSNKLSGKTIPGQLPSNVREETEIAMATLASTEPTTQAQLINTNTPIMQTNLSYNSNNLQPQVPMMTGMPLQQQQQQIPMMTGLNPQTQMMTGMTPQPQIPMQTGFQQPYQQHQQPQMQVPMQTGYMSMAPSLQTVMPTGIGRPINTGTTKPRLQNNDFASKMMPNQASRHNLLAPVLGTQQQDSISWKISPEERQRYREIFHAWETSGTGYLSGDRAREVFLQSQLLENDLMKIWTLADKENRGSLDVDEFAIAMHLIYRKLNNFDIPTVLPAELAPPSSVLKKFVIGHKPAAAPSFANSNSASSSQSARGHQAYHDDDSNDHDEYISSARRKGPPSRFKSHGPSRRVTSYESDDDDNIDTAAIDELRLQISDTKKKLDSITSSFSNKSGRRDISSTANKYSIEELKEGIRKSHSDLGRAYRSNPLTSRYLKNTETLLDLLETQRSLQDEIQYLCNRDIPVLARQLRSSAAELRDAKVRHGRKNDGGQDYTAYIQPTGPGGTITESDRVRAKAKAMMAARKIGTSSSKDANFELRRAEEEKQEYDRIADNAERDMERSREALRDLHGDLRYLSQLSDSNLIMDKKRFENGQDMSYELRRFIEQLDRDAPLGISPPSSPTTINRQYHSSSTYITDTTATSYSSSNVPPASSPAPTTNRPSVPAAKPRTAEEIKKEAERRVQERLEALRAKHNISSPKPKPSPQPSTPVIDPEEQASQQRLREAEQQAQAKLRESENQQDILKQQRENKEADLQRQQLEEQRREEERQKREENERQHLIDEEKELELRRQAIIKKEEDDRLARLKAIEDAEAAAEAAKQQNSEPSAHVPPPPPPPPPAPPASEVTDIKKPSEPLETISETSTETTPASIKKSSNNPFAKLQQSSNTEQSSTENTTTTIKPSSTTEQPSGESTTTTNKRVSYNPFAAFSAFSATKAQDNDSDSESDDGWDVVQHDDSDDEDEFPAAGSAKNLAGKLFDAMVQRQNTGSPQQFSSPVTQNITSIPAPPHPPPVASNDIPVPPPAPPAPAPPAIKSHEPISTPPVTVSSDRNALLSQIQLGAKLKKAVTNDRSQPSVSGKIIGDSSNNNPLPAPTPSVEVKQEESVPVAPSANAGNYLAELQARTNGGASSSQVEQQQQQQQQSASSSSSSSAIVDGKEYIALWDYDGQGDDDLSFKANDVILVKDGTEADDWWYGTLKESKQSGYFPRTYVDSDLSATNTTSDNHHQESELNIKGKALYDYDGPEEEGCLKIEAGASLIIINKSLGDWWTARLDNGKEGLVPANYILEDE